MTEPARQARNATKRAELHSVMQARVALIIAALEADGIRPRIQWAWRSPSQQLEMVRRGTSKLTWGFHNATAPDGTPDALAVDLLDDDHPLSPPSSYLLKLASVARAHGCQTGILWGLSMGPRENLDRAIREGRWSFISPLGWDPTHVEPADLTPAQARKGLRPAAITRREE